ncbi:MAG TPA: nuclear transport factor 2 family protein [Allosphingosinicella sp.]|jgi:hypothetical protein|nr:nuclear transport factor 2 family protein [Allosphingosinicella sp.]
MQIQPCIGRASVAFALLLLASCGPGGSSAAADPAEPAPSTRSASAPAEPEEAPAPAPADSGRDEAELIRLEHEYARALMNKDRAFLVRFYAPDWRGGNWMGFWSKSTMLKSVLSERYLVKSMKVRDLKVRLMGDSAVVQGVDEEVTTVDGRDTSGKWAFTDIFQRRGGAWVAVASHTSEVKPTE